jgi:thiamine biosynthesis lipoprotein
MLTRYAITCSRRWHAMGTVFEVFLAGADDEHLEAAASAAEEESRRLETVLSRFDPSSEIHRINRETSSRPLRLDVDVWELLAACDGYRRRTAGYFDITTGSATECLPDQRLEFDAAARTIRRTVLEVQLDLGGIGKGYALDRMGQLLRANGVSSGLLNAGTSSILALGLDLWPIDFRDPADDTGVPIGWVHLSAGGCSCSAARRPGQEVSDIIDPMRRVPVAGRAGCVVLAATATEAEALSTALLAMGRARAIHYLEQSSWPGVRVGWMDGPPSRLEWLREAS